MPVYISLLSNPPWIGLKGLFHPKIANVADIATGLHSLPALSAFFGRKIPSNLQNGNCLVLTTVVHFSSDLFMIFCTDVKHFLVCFAQKVAKALVWLNMNVSCVSEPDGDYDF